MPLRRVRPRRRRSGFGREIALPLPLRPFALQLLRPGVRSCRSAAPSAVRGIAAGRFAVQEMLAARVQRHLGAGTATSRFVTTTCADTRAVVEQPQRRREPLARRACERGVIVTCRPVSSRRMVEFASAHAMAAVSAQ